MISYEEKDIKRLLFILVGVATAIRIFIAATLEFSVDEVYYWTYALYPDWSHFDHPPMVGFVIQLFSLNLLFDSELAIRFGAIVLSALNTFTIYSIGKYIKDPLTGLYAAILLNTSIYCSVLAGNFIIPDTPQLFFWLLSLNFLIRSLPHKEHTKQVSRNFLIACALIGLAILSKYHGVFIWAGVGLYVLIFNRSWFRNPVFYIGMLISGLSLVPIVIWNINNDWISFTFHGDRVANELVIRFDYFFTEIFGQVAYNNPVNYVIIFMAIIAVYKNKISADKEMVRILLLNSLPVWLVFTSFSIFRQTLPHWTGPAFTGLILIAAIYLSTRIQQAAEGESRLLFPGILRGSAILLVAALAAAWTLINYFPGTIGKKEPIAKYGDTDFSLDMYGWRQIKEGFEEILDEDIASGAMKQDATIISPKYFPGTEIDYYIGRPLGIRVLQLGRMNDIHKYAWINKERGGLVHGADVYMISTSNWYKDPNEYYSDYFEEITPTDTIEVTRSGKLAYYAFVYLLKGYEGDYPDPLTNSE